MDNQRRIAVGQASLACVRSLLTHLCTKLIQ
jgi:hypothetical protein